ncbi:MAG: hypothetical protein KJN72_03600 [Woeseia sp.]|nr:hypothetical protein [Woeseia sp.]
MNYARVTLLTALIMLALALNLLTMNVLAAGPVTVSRIFLAVSVAAIVTIPIGVYFD